METYDVEIDIPTIKIDTSFYEKSIKSISLLPFEKLLKVKNFYSLVYNYQNMIQKAMSSLTPRCRKMWLKRALGGLKKAKKLGTELKSELSL